jgi:uncharacterized phage-associated protein
MAIAQKFDLDKALEAIIFVASKVHESSFHKISKIFYFADQLHLERYGSVLSEDYYVAMDNGPVPSHIYNMMKYASGITTVRASDKSPKILDALGVVQQYNVIAKRTAELDYLSESEVECLEESIKRHGHKTFGQLTDESHDAAWSSVTCNQPIPLKAIVDMLSNSDELVEHLYR